MFRHIHFIFVNPFFEKINYLQYNKTHSISFHKRSHLFNYLQSFTKPKGSYWIILLFEIDLKFKKKANKTFIWEYNFEYLLIRSNKLEFGWTSQSSLALCSLFPFRRLLINAYNLSYLSVGDLQTSGNNTLFGLLVRCISRILFNYYPVRLNNWNI